MLTRSFGSNARVISGSKALWNPPPRGLPGYPADKNSYCLAGRALRGGNPIYLPVTDDMLAKSLLLIGASGCGKTEILKQLFYQIVVKLSPKDLCVILDVKGEYSVYFGDCPGAVIIGAGGGNKFWNLFTDMIGLTDAEAVLYAADIAAGIFKERNKGSTNPFFPDSAAAILRDLILFCFRSGNPELMNNAVLKELACGSVARIKEILQSDIRYTTDLAALGGKQDSEMGLGVLAELHLAAADAFRGAYGGKCLPDSPEAFGPRAFIRDRGGKGARVLFIKCSLSTQAATGATDALLMSLVIRELTDQSSFGRRGGRTFFLMDELSFVPQIQELTIARDLLRGNGVRIVAGLQTVSSEYFSKSADSLFGSYQNLILMKTTDPATVDFAQKRLGKALLEVRRAAGGLQSQIEYFRFEEPSVTPGELAALLPGEAVVQAGPWTPFGFRFYPSVEGEA